MSEKHSAAKDAGVEMTSERLAKNLRTAIKSAGLTQQEVAERVDMDPTALSKVLGGKRNVSSLELALICTATGSDVLGILEAEPIHGPSYRAGMEEAERRVGIVKPDADGDYTACGKWFRAPVRESLAASLYCDLPLVHDGPHHAHLYWVDEGRDDGGMG